MPAASISNGQGPAPQHCVLVVEDVPLVRLLLADSLRALGFEVLEAGNSEDAIRAITAGFTIHAAICDIHMPGSAMDGIALARWIRSNRPDLKVLLASGVVAEVADAETLADAPLIDKPYRPLAVAERLRELLRAIAP